jgi:hypothetical protein
VTQDEAKRGRQKTQLISVPFQDAGASYFYVKIPAKGCGRAFFLKDGPERPPSAAKAA